VLDQLSDTDSKLGSVRHLTHQDLDAYATGRLASARLSACQAHLDSCDACRAELEDLRAFKAEVSGFPRPEASSREFGRRKRRRGSTLHLTAAFAVVLVAATAAVLWVRHEGPRKSKPSAAVSVAQSPVALRTANAQPHGTRVAGDVATRQVEARPPTPEPTQHDKLQSVPDVSRSPTPAPPADAKKSFALLGPRGSAIAETRPEFSWQPLPGAIHYSVAIVDARLHPVQRSPALRKTVWRPRRPLRPGRTYLWQVTATLRGGSKVVASEPGVLTESAGKAPADDSSHDTARTRL
jgi:hypothetical protein